MASYLRSWLVPSTLPPPAPSFEISAPSPPASDNELDNDNNDDDDLPPPFPSLASAQRTAGPSALAPKRSAAMGPPALRIRARAKSTDEDTESSGLALPPSTTKPMPNTNKKGRVRAKVALAPGHSALDWGRLKSSGADLRGVTSLMRISIADLRKHNKPDDAWAAFYGKVYNITPYLPFHPGGQHELMRVAGRDGTKLFANTHSWVNLDFMLDESMVGFLIPE